MDTKSVQGRIFCYRGEFMFQIEEELKKLPGKPGGLYYAWGEGRDHLCWEKAVSLKKQGASIFPEQQK